ncbi:MAG: hypothetical protein DRG40_06240 [Deltaproteobacteria bacterium]|nr:MAG: hypothetical protein DRG40_06240 [Deltaproteobacteria bacterium]
MRERVLKAAIAVLLAIIPALAHGLEARIDRITYTREGIVRYPSLSEDGRVLLYVHEAPDEKVPLKVHRSLKVVFLETGEKRTIFRDGEVPAPAPFKGRLLLGSKPPRLSGDGKRATFLLSLPRWRDHFLAVAEIRGKKVRVFELEMEGVPLKAKGFKGKGWARIVNYATDREGRRIACAVKGDMTEGGLGYPSGIVLLEFPSMKKRTFLAPRLKEKGWVWEGFPSKPFLGGGWVFAMSPDGEWLLFGAKASQEKGDYDLFAMSWEGEIERLTHLHSPYFVLGHIGPARKPVVFYFAGQKTGTYLLGDSGPEPLFLPSGERLDYEGISGDGRYILYCLRGKGYRYDWRRGTWEEIFSPSTSGYTRSPYPMSFPSYPAYWSARFSSWGGERLILMGRPRGKEKEELYLLEVR